MSITPHSNRNPVPLWPWALALYERPSIAAACLQLQDEAGLDVCELLWGLWLLAHDRAPSGDLAQALAPVRQWQRRYTYPLRAQRQQLKALLAEQPELADMRTHIKRAELESEKAALAQLEALNTQGTGVIARNTALPPSTLLMPLTGPLSGAHQQLISLVLLESESMTPPSS